MATERSLRSRVTKEALITRLGSRKYVPYYFALPFVILYSVFFLFPTLWAPRMSLFEFSFVGNTFVGLDNYRWLFSSSSQFETVLWNTMVIASIKVPLQTIAGLTLALLVNSGTAHFKRLFRTTFIAPIIMSTTVIGLLFKLMLAQNGVLNGLLLSIAGVQIGWLVDPFWAKVSVALGEMYRETSIAFLIFLAGLQGIDPSLYQAAKMDGANRLQQVRYITIPQLRPIIVLVVILATSDALKIFATPLIMTEGGGPGNASKTIVLYLYEVGFQTANLGKAAAIGTVLTILLGAIMVVQYRFGSKNE